MTTASKAQPRLGDGYLGRTLDERYRLDEVIGAGAIGKVYAGTQLAVDRKVAIKLLHHSVQDRELGTERFLREAKAVARLSHSTCLTLFDFGLDEALNCFYMVTEFVQGETLAEHMSRSRLSVEQVFYLLFQITTALEHAHESGILHRDLKPENIMLVGGADSNSGAFASIKVLDFGLARIREEAATQDAQGAHAGDAAGENKPEEFRLTHFGELNGTPAYMSPEQCRGELDLTPACDYYALGVLAFELFEGRLPFEATAVNELLSMHLDDPIPRMTRGRAPDDVEALIYRLMGKNSDFRLQSSAEILDVLRAHMAPEAAHRVSMETMERFQAQAQAEVAVPGAETLDNYDPADTPLPAPVDPSVPIEFRETLVSDAGEELANSKTHAEAAQNESSKQSRALILAGLVAALSIAASLVWWAGFADSTSSTARADAELHAGSNAAVGAVERGVAGRDSPRKVEVPGAGVEPVSIGARANRDAGFSVAAAAGDASAQQEAAQAPNPAPARPERVEPAAQHPRPRKLELTY
jgi:serine/threonine-protein kinase